MAPKLAQTFSRVYVFKTFVKIGQISIVRKGFRLDTSYFRTRLSLHFTHHFEFGLRGTQKDTDLQPFGIKFVQISNFVEVGQHSKEMGLETSFFFRTLPSTCLNSEDYNSTYDNEDNNRTDSYTTFLIRGTCPQNGYFRCQHDITLLSSYRDRQKCDNIFLRFYPLNLRKPDLVGSTSFGSKKYTFPTKQMGT